MNYFPPNPVYPKDYDSDATLFLVRDTAETVTVADDFPWAEEIQIRPAAGNEVWATNGFANIDGELFYYDSVGYDSSGKVNLLKRCSRNLGGTHTKKNLSGSEVRGFVVAEHHNQLVDALVNVQNFVGENFTLDKATLDWRIRNLQQLPAIFDDFTCPDVTFDFFILAETAESGIVGQYSIVIDGSFTSYRLDFGDGEFTTTSTKGTHRYSRNSTIDPVLTIVNPKCTIVQTPIQRAETGEPAPQAQQGAFEIKLPSIPRIPNFTIPSIPIPSNIVTPPPIVFPCLDIGPLGSLVFPSVINIQAPLNVPSFINFGPLHIPTTITFAPLPTIISFSTPVIPTTITISPVVIPTLITISPVTIPTLITISPVVIPTLINFGLSPLPTVIDFGPSTLPTVIDFGPSPLPTLINFGPAPNLTSYITFGPAPNITSHITFGPAPNITSYIMFGPAPQLGPIYFGPAPTFSLIYFGPAPAISINWGTPPTLSCVISVDCPANGPAPAPAPFRANSHTLFESEPLEVQMTDLGIPSEILVKIPEIPDVRMLHDIPSVIRVEAPNIPDIRIIAPLNFPSEIRLVSDLPKSIELSHNLPKSISLDTSDMPKSIKLEVPDSFPMLKIDASGIPDKIQVVGIPPSIALVGPSEIKLVMPDKPEIELVYRGAPIDVKINLDISRLTGEDGTAQCVSIVPCRAN